VSHAGGNVDYTGAELEHRPESLPERPPQNLPVPYRRGGAANVLGWLLLGLGLLVTGLALILGQRDTGEFAYESDEPAGHPRPDASGRRG
jgi:hypothetical protein